MNTFQNLLRNCAPSTMVLCIGLLGASGLFGDVASCLAGKGPTPGNSVSPTNCTGQGAGTLLADLFVPFSFTTTAGTTSGTLESAVYLDGSTLDFYYQVTNASTSATALARETDTNFKGFATNAGFRTDGSTFTGTSFVNGTVLPATADRDVTGSVVGFNFNLPDPKAEIGPGETSYVLIISTNATQFAPGNASIIDGGTETVAAFQPAGVPVGAVPEPALGGLLGLGLVGLVGFRDWLARSAPTK